MRALLVVNPKATATTSRTRDVLARALASETKLDVAQTTSRGHATALARQARADGFDVVVALGGDGTVNEVVNGLLAGGPGEDVPAFAVVPGGSANVFARSLGLPPGAVDATGDLIDALHDGRRRTLGLGRADERWFTFTAGIGLDAEVVERVEQRRAAGRKATPGLYVRSGMRQFFTSTERREAALTLHRPGQDDVEGVHLAIVSNTSPWTYLGSRPVHPSPHASFETGLDLLGVTRLGTVGTLTTVGRMLVGTKGPRGRRVVSLHDEDEITVTASRPVALQVDGDYLGQVSRVRLTSVPKALDVVV